MKNPFKVLALMVVVTALVMTALSSPAEAMTLGKQMELYAKEELERESTTPKGNLDNLLESRKGDFPVGVKRFFGAMFRVATLGTHRLSEDGKRLELDLNPFNALFDLTGPITSGVECTKDVALTGLNSVRVPVVCVAKATRIKPLSDVTTLAFNTTQIGVTYAAGVVWGETAEEVAQADLDTILNGDPTGLPLFNYLVKGEGESTREGVTLTPFRKLVEFPGSLYGIYLGTHTMYTGFGNHPPRHDIVFDLFSPGRD